jgi:hypothetical protein
MGAMQGDPDLPPDIGGEVANLLVEGALQFQVGIPAADVLADADEVSRLADLSRAIFLTKGS